MSETVVYTSNVKEAAERVHDFHADSCPIARTIKGRVDISTELQFE